MPAHQVDEPSLMVRFDRGLIAGRSPRHRKSSTWPARPPDRDVRLGGDHSLSPASAGRPTSPTLTAASARHARGQPQPHPPQPALRCDPRAEPERRGAGCRPAVPPLCHHRGPADAVRQAARASTRAARRRCATASKWSGSPAGSTRRIRGTAVVLHRDQHQLAAPARHPDVPGHHRFRPRRPDDGDRPVHARRRDGTDDHGRRAGAAARRGAGRHRAGAVGAAGRTGGLRLVHLQRRHEVRARQRSAPRSSSRRRSAPASSPATSACRGAVRRRPPPTRRTNRRSTSS